MPPVVLNLLIVLDQGIGFRPAGSQALTEDQGSEWGLKESPMPEQRGLHGALPLLSDLGGPRQGWLKERIRHWRTLVKCTTSCSTYVYWKFFIFKWTYKYKIGYIYGKVAEIVQRAPLYPVLTFPYCWWYIYHNYWTNTDTLILTEVHNSFIFPSFFPLMSFSWPRIPIMIPYCI